METPEILIVQKPITRVQAQELAEKWHGRMVKGVADCRQGIVALGGEWHMDANVCLLKEGSSQEDIWGFNLYPFEEGPHALEYISLINIRPAQNNRDMELKDQRLRDTIKKLLRALVPDLPL